MARAGAACGKRGARDGCQPTVGMPVEGGDSVYGRGVVVDVKMPDDVV
jgi:hypothetical protein